jgi:hypothetical protein
MHNEVNIKQYFWEAAVLVLLKWGIYEVRRWDGFMWHDIRTNKGMVPSDMSKPALIFFSMQEYTL